MDIARVFLAAMTVAASVSCSPAADRAEPGALAGSYTFIADGRRTMIDSVPQTNGQTSTTTWMITPCGAGCSHVASSLGWTLELHLVDNAWRGTRVLADICAGDDGTKSTLTYELNTSDLAGKVTNYMPCSHPPKTAVTPARLTAAPGYR